MGWWVTELNSISLILGSELRHEKVKWLAQGHVAVSDGVNKNLHLSLQLPELPVLLWHGWGAQELWTWPDTSMQTEG